MKLIWILFIENSIKLISFGFKMIKLIPIIPMIRNSRNSANCWFEAYFRSCGNACVCIWNLWFIFSFFFKILKKRRFTIMESYSVQLKHNDDKYKDKSENSWSSNLFSNYSLNFSSFLNLSFSLSSSLFYNLLETRNSIENIFKFLIFFFRLSYYYYHYYVYSKIIKVLFGS